MGHGTENEPKIRQLIFLVIHVFWCSNFVSLVYFIRGRSCAKIKSLTPFILLFSASPYFRGISDQREDRNDKNLKKENSNYNDFSTGPLFLII